MPTNHRWSVSPESAIKIQLTLAPMVSQTEAAGEFRVVAGADVAFSKDMATAIAAVVVWNVNDGCVVETRSATAPVTFPYIPGLLTFREAPALLKAIRRLKTRPDAFLFDGHGFSHPRRIGLASHLGLILDAPSAGCAKSRLIGDHVQPGSKRGSRRPLKHKRETLGAVLRTRDGVKPVYVSVGHRMSLDQAVALVLACGRGFRLPEPTRLADRMVAETRWSCNHVGGGAGA